MIQIKAPDGSLVQFPDGTPDETIVGVMSKEYPHPAAGAAAAAADVSIKDAAPEQGGVLGTLADVAKSAGTGLAKGIAHIPSAYGDLRDLISLGAQKAAAFALEKTGQLPAGATADEFLADINRPTPSDPYATPGVLGTLARGLDQPAPNSAQIDSVIQGSPVAPLFSHQPQTRAGEYADTIGQFLPMSLAGPGGMARNAVRFGVGPAIASQGAGDATKGTAAEPWARAGAAILASGAGALATGPTAEQAALARAVRGVDAPTMQNAQRLMEDAAARGIRLSSAEAIQQASGGASQMGRLQRVVEGTEGGGGVFQPAMAQRPAQVAGAVNDVLDRIAPASQQPSLIGLRGQEAATGAIDAVNRRINDASRPFYRAAEAQTIAPSEFAPIANDPAFQTSLRRLRANEVLGPQYAHLPDNSIGVVDAVTKDMRARGEALGNVVNPGFQPQEAASYGTGATEARDIARDPARGGNANYDLALALQQHGRQTFLDPLEAGPLGRIGGTPDVRAQADALFPNAPLEGAPAESAAAVQHLNQQNPTVAADLSRQHLAGKFAEATQNLQSGPNQWGGAKFAANVAGNPIQRETLVAALGGLPNGGRITPDVQGLIQALEATGKRQAAGSLTAFNAQDLKNLSEPGALAALGEAGKTLSPGPLWRKVADSLERARLESRSATLARMLLADPAEAFGQIGRAQAASPEFRGRLQALAAILSGRSGAISEPAP